jgi:hypothetical protein
VRDDHKLLESQFLTENVIETFALARSLTLRGAAEESPHEMGTGGYVMLRKIMIAATAIAFVGAMAASTAADARIGGFGGARIGGFGGAGFRAAGIGMRGGFVGARPFVGARSFVGPRRFAFTRFNRFNRFNRFAFAAAVPFFVGTGFYGACWSWVPTAWGWQRVWVCNDYYGYY